MKRNPKKTEKGNIGTVDTVEFKACLSDILQLKETYLLTQVSPTQMKRNPKKTEKEKLVQLIQLNLMLV